MALLPGRGPAGSGRPFTCPAWSPRSEPRRRGTGSPGGRAGAGMSLAQPVGAGVGGAGFGDARMGGRGIWGCGGGGANACASLGWGAQPPHSARRTPSLSAPGDGPACTPPCVGHGSRLAVSPRPHAETRGRYTGADPGQGRGALCHRSHVHAELYSGTTGFLFLCCRIDPYGFERPEDFDYAAYEEFFSTYLVILTRRAIKWSKLLKGSSSVQKSMTGEFGPWSTTQQTGHWLTVLLGGVGFCIS